MTLPGYNHKFGQQIMTDIEGVDIDRAFLAHFHIDAADAVAADAGGILPLTKLGADAKSIEDGFTQPAVPRNVTIVASVANVAGTVKIHGTNFAGEVIDETIALNATATSAKAGNKAFKTITKVDLPARTNAPAKQKATIAVTQGAQGAGTTIFTFTSAATGAAYDISVEFAAEDSTTAKAATVLAAALNADAKFKAKWVAAVATANITIESLTYAAQDTTINLVVKTAGEPNVTLGTITNNTTSGVAEDKVSIGLGKKFGLPYCLYADELAILKLFNKATETPTEGAITADATNLENNVYEPNGSPDGQKDIDLYIIV